MEFRFVSFLVTSRFFNVLLTRIKPVIEIVSYGMNYGSSAVTENDIVVLKPSRIKRGTE